MAEDKKISQLDPTADNDVTLDDIVALVDLQGTPTTKRVTLQQIKNAFGVMPSSGSVKAFLKDSTLTTAHIGLLAMQKVTPLNGNPQSLADFDVKAVLADTVAATPGVKGEYLLGFSGIILEQPESKIIRVLFNNNPLPGNSIVFKDDNNSTIGTVTFKSAGNANAGSNEIEIGATLADTVHNVVNHFSSLSTSLTSQYARVEAYTDIYTDGNPHIDFEMRFNDPLGDSYKYLHNSSIDTGFDTFNGAVNKTGSSLVDSFGNTALFVTDGIDIGDGYYHVTSVGGQDQSGGSWYCQNADASTDIYVKIAGVYYLVDSYSRLEDGQLNWAASSYPYNNGVFTVFPVWHASGNSFSISTIRDINIPVAQVAQSINQAATNQNYILLASSWDSNNGGQTLISYASLFRNDAGQPNGTFGAFGLKYFADDTEAVAALTWALNNTSGGWFNTMFDVVTPLAYNSDHERYEVTVRNKTAPTSPTGTYFQAYQAGGVNNITQVISGSQSGRAERIPYAIIGKIVGIDGNNALIDTSFIFDVTMCSEADGAFGILPYSDELNYGNYIPAIIAWRGGKVIDLAGYYNLMQNAGYAGDNLMLTPLLVGGYYRPVGAAAPDGQIAIDGKFILFGN